MKLRSVAPARLLGFLSTLMLLLSCAGPFPDVVEQKRQFILWVRTQTLVDLFNSKPNAKRQLADAAGYAVFSNIESDVVVVPRGTAYGVAVDNSTGREVFMRMFMAGPEAGDSRPFRALLVFERRATLEKFLAYGLRSMDDVQSTREAAATSRPISPWGAGNFDPEIMEITDSGVPLPLDLGGAEYWRDDELNSAAPVPYPELDGY